MFIIITPKDENEISMRVDSLMANTHEAGESSASRSLEENTAAVLLQSNDAIDPADLHSPCAKRRKTIYANVKDLIAKANGEQDIKSKRRILDRGIEETPDSALLWEARVQIEKECASKEIVLNRLNRAVIHYGNCVSLWLTLAGLKSYDDAKTVLKKAKDINPTSIQIRITLAKHEEKTEIIRAGT